MACNTLYTAATELSEPPKIPHYFFYILDEENKKYYLQSLSQGVTTTFKTSGDSVRTLTFQPIGVDFSEFPLTFTLDDGHGKGVLKIQLKDLTSQLNKSGSKTLSSYLVENHHLEVHQRVSIRFITIDTKFSDLTNTLSSFHNLLGQSKELTAIIGGVGGLSGFLFISLALVFFCLCCCPQTLRLIMDRIGHFITFILTCNRCGKGIQPFNYQPPHDNVQLQ